MAYGGGEEGFSHTWASGGSYAAAEGEINLIPYEPLIQR